MAGRYRRFRRESQNEGRWYRKDGVAAADLHPLEVDIILLALLRNGLSLLADRRISRSLVESRYAALLPFQALYRTQILVDEATDFSPVQLACMAALSDPGAQSFVACGDFNQRITEWGSRSNADLSWVFPDFDIRSISITYRHSRQLNELARSIALLSSPDVPEAQLPQRVNNDGFDPVLAYNLATPPLVAGWLAQRITEIEHLAKGIPPVAVLVSDEEEVGPLAAALNQVLGASNIRAVPCINGQLVGQDNDVRVFAVEHIKGLEFEAVFFVGIDRLAERHPDLFEKYLYVGATRAALFLGLTTAGPALPGKVASLRDRFKAQWP
jgi:superfamily I DNA/RNA helicase